MKNYTKHGELRHLENGVNAMANEEGYLFDIDNGDTEHILTEFDLDFENFLFFITITTSSLD
jgi:hypothetical protein